MLTTIRSKLIVLVAVAALLALAIGGVGLYGNNRLELAADNAEANGLALAEFLKVDLAHDAIFAYAEQLNGAAKDNSQERIADAAKSLKEAVTDIRVEYAKIEKLDFLSAEDKASVVKFKPDIESYAKDALAIAALTVADAEFEKNRIALGVKFKALSKDLKVVEDRFQKNLETTHTIAAEIVRVDFLLMLGTIVVGGLVLLGAAMVTYRAITGGLNQLESTIAGVNKGDSAARTNMTSQDELGHLGRSFDALLDDRIAKLEVKIKENDAINNSAINLLQTVFALSEKDLTARANVSDDIVGTISSSVNQFASETSETLSEVQQIAEQVRGAAQAAQQQGQLVQGAAERERTLLESMGVTLGNASRQLNDVALLSTASGVAAAKTSEATKAAQQAVDGSMRGMDSLREAISEAEKRFKRLGERSQEISAAVALVNTISERTHVLSLNASMQAATAGEAGRGFAVVATEVQRLSDSSRQATGEIAKLVSNIQAETNETLITMNRLISNVVTQTELARRAGQEMTQTQASTNELVGLVGQIASFSALQQAMSLALQKNVQVMNEGTAQTSAAIELQSNATDTLVQFADRLNKSVAQFKVSAGGAVVQPA